ncbi:MAG: EamA family transporter, partial [Bacillota bacterium]
ILALDLAPAVWAVLVVLGVGPTYLAYRLYTHGLRLVPASTAAIVAMVEPVVAALLGWLLLRETLTASQVAGGFLVLLGAVLARDRSPRPGAAGPGLPGAGNHQGREKNHGYPGERRG